jgi:hypothetical protein
MWNEMVKANWMRESSRGSSSGICVPCLFAAFRGTASNATRVLH